MSQFPGFSDHASRNAALLGGVLLLLGVLLLGFTGHADRLRVMSEDALGGFVLTGAAAVPGPASDGKLVLAAGNVDVREAATDPQFGVAVDAPALLRKVAMFQWKETDYAGRLGYEQAWVDHPIDSSAFTEPARHTNPGTFPIGAVRFDSPGVRVAGFKLAPQLVATIAGVEHFSPDFASLPANMAATFRRDDGELVTSSNPARPRVGDLRVSWMKIDPAALTVFARSHGGTLVPARNPRGDSIAQVLIGNHSLSDVLVDAPQAPRFKWARRVASLLLAWAGVAWLLPRARRRDRMLSLATAIVPLALVAAASWWGVRMPVVWVLVAVAVVATAVAIWRWRSMSTA